MPPQPYHPHLEERFNSHPVPSEDEQVRVSAVAMYILRIYTYRVDLVVMDRAGLT